MYFVPSILHQYNPNLRFDHLLLLTQERVLQKVHAGFTTIKQKIYFPNNILARSLTTSGKVLSIVYLIIEDLKLIGTI